MNRFGSAVTRHCCSYSHCQDAGTQLHLNTSPGAGKQRQLHRKAGLLKDNAFPLPPVPRLRVSQRRPLLHFHSEPPASPRLHQDTQPQGFSNQHVSFASFCSHEGAAVRDSQEQKVGEERIYPVLLPRMLLRQLIPGPQATAQTIQFMPHSTRAPFPHPACLVRADTSELKSQALIGETARSRWHLSLLKTGGAYPII